MKSAYELALERLESQGIERPKAESLPEEVREEIAEARRKAEAELAELEILHKKRLQTMDPGERDQEKDDYVLERRRIEEKRDRRIEKLRAGA